MRALGRVERGREEFYLRWLLGSHLIDHWLKKINKLLISWTDEVGWEFRTYAEVRAGCEHRLASTVPTQIGVVCGPRLFSIVDSWEIRAFREERVQT